MTGPWAFRVAWALLAVVAGPAFDDALGGASRPVQLVASVGLWLGWAAVLAASLVPRASTLTVLRLAGPAPLVAAVAAAVLGTGEVGADDAVALGLGAAVAAAVALPATVDAFVDGSSYGSERRFALRTPVPLVVAGGVAWLLAVALPATGALVLAAGQPVGAVLLVAGVGGAWLGVRALHRLSRRWLVLVPAGLVVHDRLALPEPVLLPRSSIAAFGPALAGSTAHDLSAGAPGLTLQLSFTAPADLAPGVHVADVLVTPLRPGAVLAEASTRRYPVAVAAPTTSSPS